MVNEVRRDIVKIGIDFRPIPVDLGDGVEWEFTPDPSPPQWTILVDALQKFTKFNDEDFGGDAFVESLDGLTNAMAQFLISDEQKELWAEKAYGLGPQQAISQALMELWTGFPTKQPSPSGKGQKRTG